MVWSQFSIKIFGVHSDNSVLDNSSWDKITYMWVRWGTPQNFLLEFIDEFSKTRKTRLLKKWKRLLEISSFTHVYQKPQSYEVQFLRYEVRRNFLSFWTIFCLFNPLPPKTKQPTKPKLKKKYEKNIYRCHHFKLVLQKNTIIWFMLTQIWSSCIDIIFLSFQVIFCFFVPLLTPKIKIWKKCKKCLNILSFYTCVPLINIIWCMVPETWSSTDGILLSSWAIFCLLPS